MTGRNGKAGEEERRKIEKEGAGMKGEEYEMKKSFAAPCRPLLRIRTVQKILLFFAEASRSARLGFSSLCRFRAALDAHVSDNLEAVF